MLALILLSIVAVTAAGAGWRFAVTVWQVETPRQAIEAAWYRLNPPRTIQVGTLQQRILRAAVGARVVSVRGMALVPSTFEVALHPDDLASIAGVRDWIASELTAALEERAAKESWELSGRPLITFLADERRVPGRPEVRARHEPRTVALAGLAPGAGAAPADEPEPRVGWLRPLGDDDPVGLTARRTVVLGRGGTAPVDLGHPSISRRHCELRPEGGSWVAEDLGSANGTTVNGRPLTAPTVLSPGDELCLGDTVRFVAEALDPATQAAPPPGPSSMPRTKIVG